MLFGTSIEVQTLIFENSLMTTGQFETSVATSE